MTSQKKLLNELTNKTHIIEDIQIYLKKVIKIRGLSKQKPSDKILLLTEELGELAKAIRKFERMPIDEKRIENYSNISDEIADIFIVLISLCNTLDIDIFKAFIKKEKINIERVWNK